ncbi:MAG: DUF6807 family protein [Candidatus Hodarchaeota archaeon]
MVMFDHPLNPRYPTPVRIHPELPYYSWALVQDEPYSIRRDAPLRLQYRVMVHDNTPDPKTNERLAADFVDPPRVELRF